MPPRGQSWPVVETGGAGGTAALAPAVRPMTTRRKVGQDVRHQSNRMAKQLPIGTATVFVRVRLPWRDHLEGADQGFSTGK